VSDDSDNDENGDVSDDGDRDDIMFDDDSVVTMKMTMIMIVMVVIVRE